MKNRAIKTFHNIILEADDVKYHLYLYLVRNIKITAIVSFTLGFTLGLLL